MWAYGVQLWSMASNSNVEIQRFQNKFLKIINALWLATIHYHDLNVPYVKDEIRRLKDMLIDWRNILTFS